MKFLIDEDLSPKLVRLFQKLGYSSIHIREIKLSLGDSQILEIAVDQDYIVVTADKDFGELVFKDSKSHQGVIFLRLEDQTIENTIKVLMWFFSIYSDQKLESHFITITEKEGKFKARFGKIT